MLNQECQIEKTRDPKIDFTRRVSSIFDVFGYIGGIFGVLSSFAEMIVGPIAEFNFYYKLL